MFSHRKKKRNNDLLEFTLPEKIFMPFLILFLAVQLTFQMVMPSKKDIKKFLQKSIKWVLIFLPFALLLGIPLIHSITETPLPEIYPLIVLVCMFIFLFVLLAASEEKYSNKYGGHNYNNGRYNRYRDNDDDDYDGIIYWAENREKRMNGGLTNKEVKKRKEEIKMNLMNDKKVSKSKKRKLVGK